MSSAAPSPAPKGRPPPTPSNQRVFQRILTYVDPNTFYLSAPYVSKDFYTAYTAVRPRLVLLNLHLVSASELDGSDSSARSSSSSSTLTTNSGTGNGLTSTPGFHQSHVQLSKVFITPEWSTVPAAVRRVFAAGSNSTAIVGNSRAGLGVVAKIAFEHMPHDTAAVGELVQHLSGAVRVMYGASKDGKDGKSGGGARDVFVIPWEVTVGDGILSSASNNFTNRSRLLQILSQLGVLSVTVRNPPKDIFRVLSSYPSLYIVNLEEVRNRGAGSSSAEGGIDFQSGGLLPNLCQLTLNSPEPLDDEEAPEGEELPAKDQSDKQESSTPNSSSNVYSLASIAPRLQRLRVSTWYPIPDYTTFASSALLNLHYLESLYITGLIQGDQDPALLARVLVSMPRLQHLHRLGDVDQLFWKALLAETKGRPLMNMKTLTLSWSASACIGVVGAALAGVSKLMPNLQELTLRFLPVPGAPDLPDEDSTEAAAIHGSDPEVAQLTKSLQSTSISSTSGPCTVSLTSLTTGNLPTPCQQPVTASGIIKIMSTIKTAMLTDLEASIAEDRPLKRTYPWVLKRVNVTGLPIPYAVMKEVAALNLKTGMGVREFMKVQLRCDAFWG
ncbi:hypothetical protein HK102_005485, partial [Quaeritorhiza haematococci]